MNYLQKLNIKISKSKKNERKKQIENDDFKKTMTIAVKLENV